MATITLHRPEAANALNAAMIDDIDAAFDRGRSRRRRARSWCSRAEGKHFSAGHDLKELFDGDRARGRRCATRPRASCTTSRSCTSTAACGSATSASRPSPRCRAAARRRADAGVHVRPDRRRRRRRVLEPGAAHDGRRRRAAGRAVGARRPQGQGVPPLRRDARRRSRPSGSGSSTGSCPAPSSTRAAREMADKIALVPPITAQVVKDIDQRTPSTAWASATPGGTTSWSTSSCRTPTRAERARGAASSRRHGRGEARAAGRRHAAPDGVSP